MLRIPLISILVNKTIKCYFIYVISIIYNDTVQNMNTHAHVYQNPDQIPSFIETVQTENITGIKL